MNNKSNRKTNNLKSIAEFNDQEFLNFLYAERERLKSNEDYPGWTIWAIVGTIGVLLNFVYYTIEDVGGAIDLKLCYYIFSIFCPISLYFVMLYETRHSFRFFSYRHVQRLIDAAPKLVLGFYIVLYATMVLVGLLIDADIRIVGLWAFSLVVYVVCLASVILFRNKLVCSLGGFRFSHWENVNRVLLFLFSGVIIMPWVIAKGKLIFGFSKEFECSLTIVMVVVFCYLLLRFFYVDNYSSKLDELIENYLYRGLDKHSVMKRYEEIVLGKRPFDLLENRYYALIDSMKESETVEKNVRDLITKVKTIDECDECLWNVPNELVKDIDFIKKFITAYSSFREGVDEMLAVKTSILDEDFRTMLDTMVASGDEFDATVNRLQSVQDMIHEISELITPKLEKLICTRDCPNRCLTKIYK